MRVGGSGDTTPCEMTRVILRSPVSSYTGLYPQRDWRQHLQFEGRDRHGQHRRREKPVWGVQVSGSRTRERGATCLPHAFLVGLHAARSNPGTNLGTIRAYHPTALPTVGLYTLLVPGFVSGKILSHDAFIN